MSNTEMQQDEVSLSPITDSTFGSDDWKKYFTPEEFRRMGEEADFFATRRAEKMFDEDFRAKNPKVIEDAIVAERDQIILRMLAYQTKRRRKKEQDKLAARIKKAERKKVRDRAKAMGVQFLHLDERISGGKATSTAYLPRDGVVKLYRITYNPKDTYDVRVAESILMEKIESGAQELTGILIEANSVIGLHQIGMAAQARLRGLEAHVRKVRKAPKYYNVVK